MKTLTTYISDDGKIFENELECLQYELSERCKKSKVKVFGKHNKRLKEFWTDQAYDESLKVVVPDEEALEDIKAVTRYNGTFCEITDVGIWRYKESDSNLWLGSFILCDK
jgi:hypothetical protein